MQRLDHVAELVEHRERLRPRTVGVMRREERDRLVAPVVHPERRILRVELEDRQQLDGGDSQLLQIRNLLDQPGVGPARRLGHPGARIPGEATNVQLVDDGLGERPAQRPVALPVIAAGVGDDALHRRRGVAARPARGPAVEVRRHGDRQPVRIEQDLVAVEALAPFRLERPVGAVGVDLSGSQAGHHGMPVVVRPMGGRAERNDSRRRGRRLVIEQQQLDERRVLREDAEVDAARHDGGAEGSARTDLDRRQARRLHDPERHRYPCAPAIGLTFQISRQYSRMERSDENRPTRALLRIDMRVQAAWSA